jgi:ketosteroid isomerase-like protein
MSKHQPTTTIELTRHLFAAANIADYNAILAPFAAEAVWDVSIWGLGSHSGLVAIRHSLEGWMGSFEDYSVAVEKLVDLGGGVVFAVATQHARAEGGGRLELRYAPVFVWDGETLVRVTHYRDVAEGRAAAEVLAGARSALSA